MTLSELKAELRGATTAPAVNTLQLLAWLYEVVCELERLDADALKISDVKKATPTSYLPYTGPDVLPC